MRRADTDDDGNAAGGLHRDGRGTGALLPGEAGVATGKPGASAEATQPRNMVAP
ncbi:hypothetical protein AB0D38_30845 [Streptomyces sp. NPDC048279]|uniref:hypothetical protein n=1 Tax=Streptomyces sp. NPDC048279 TaxID=3154714 RepID=UPI0034298ADA